MCVCFFLSLCVCVCVFMCVYLCVCLYVHARVCVCVCVYANLLAQARKSICKKSFTVLNPEILFSATGDDTNVKERNLAYYFH